MNPNLTDLIDRFAGLDVVVIGDAMLDSYVEGSTHRFCQEAPVPVVKVMGQTDLPGGAANTAVNVSRLGARAHLLAVVGEDSQGTRLRQMLSQQRVSTEDVPALPGRRTLHKERVLAAGQMLLRLDQGSTEPVGSSVEEALIGRLAELYPRCAAVILSDYGYGVLTPAVLHAVADLQTRWSPVLVADSRRLAAFRTLAPTAVKPNFTEAAGLLGDRGVEITPVRADAIVPSGERILELTGAQIAAVTLDSEGAVVFERGRPPYRTYVKPMRQASVVGAGDTFTAALALALAAGATTPEAAELASAAAAVVVGKERTSSCCAHELRELFATGDKCIRDVVHFQSRLDFYRQQGRRIVFTNGCFDILHRGHITYLNRAKTLGDVLVVGVNSDDSIRRLKGQPAH